MSVSAEHLAFQQLVNRAKAGDQSAMIQLVESYEPDVRIAARVHLSPAMRPYLDSLDLVQSVHRSLLCGLKMQKYDFQSPNGLLALALLMVQRKVARQWRKHRRQQRLDHMTQSSEWFENELSALTTADSDATRSLEVKEAVARMYRNLDDVDRQLLELRLLGWSTVEAAQQLGHSPEALRIRLFRLRKKLSDEKMANEWL